MALQEKAPLNNYGERSGALKQKRLPVQGSLFTIRATLNCGTGPHCDSAGVVPAPPCVTASG